MKRIGIISVAAAEAARLERFCREPPGRGNCMGKDVPLFDVEHTFDNGMRMAVQVCPSTDPDTESCWTQGVLFEPGGCERGWTDVGESLLGEFCVVDGDDEYVVDVQAQKGRMLITYDLLRLRTACAGAFTTFKELWPDGCYVTHENVRKAALAKLSIVWFMDRFGPRDTRSKFKEEAMQLFHDNEWRFQGIVDAFARQHDAIHAAHAQDLDADAFAAALLAARADCDARIQQHHEDLADKLATLTMQYWREDPEAVE